MLRRQLLPRLRPQETLVAESNCQVPHSRPRKQFFPYTDNPFVQNKSEVSLCLFMGHVEEKYFDRYAARTPNLHKRYIDDIAGAFFIPA